MSEQPIGQRAGLLSPWVDGTRMKMVSRLIAPGSRVLDVGCGRGLLIPYLPSECPYVGVDHDRRLIEANRQKFPQHFFREIEADSNILPFNPEAFDVVVMAALLERLKNPRILLSEVSRVLKSQGLAVATTASPLGGHLQGFLGKIHFLSFEVGEDREDFLTKEKLAATLPMTGLQLSDHRSFQMGLNQIFVFKKEPRRE